MASQGGKNQPNHFKKSLIFTHDKLVPVIICVIGSTLQVLSLFTLYFSFPTTTIIDLYRPTKVDLPSISLCFLYFINESEIAKTIDSRDDPGYSGSELTSFDLTLEELNLLTPKVEDYIISCKVANASIDPNQLFNTVDCADVCPVRIALSPILKCFTWFAYMKEHYQYHINDFHDDPFLSIVINSNLSSDKLTLVFVHDNDEEVAFSNGSPEMTILDFTLHNKFIMTYYTISTTQLSKPYSNCEDYTKIFGSSKQNLIKKCIYETIYEDHKAYHDRALVSVSHDVTNVTFNQGIPMSRYRSECETAYPNEECEYRLFEVKTLHSEFESDKEPGSISIYFSFPLGLQSTVTMVKKFNDIEFFCYVASIISLWLEVSMLTVAKFLFYHLRKIVLRLIRNQAINSKKRSQSNKNKRKKISIKKIKVLNSKPKISWIPNIYDYYELQSFYPRYIKASGPRYPVPHYYY